MRALADFVMRGRAQAILVAVLGILMPFFAWVSTGVVGLVALRRGGRDGFLVFAWSLLAAFAVFMWRGDIGPATALAGTMVAALVLRWSVSWPHALLAASIVGALSSLLLLTVGSGYVEKLLALLNPMFDELRRQMPAGQGAAIGALSAAQVSGLLGFRTVCAAVAGLLLARWWQAGLYNPGGFREEFHRLRLPLPLALGLVVAIALTLLPGVEYRVWALIFAVPFVVAGFALVHGVVGLKGWGRGPLVVLYVAWLLLWELVTIALLLLALFDSGWDFRGRLRASKPQ